MHNIFYAHVGSYLMFTFKQFMLDLFFLKFFFFKCNTYTQHGAQTQNHYLDQELYVPATEPARFFWTFFSPFTWSIKRFTVFTWQSTICSQQRYTRILCSRHWGYSREEKISLFEQTLYRNIGCKLWSWKEYDIKESRSRLLWNIMCREE